MKMNRVGFALLLIFLTEIALGQKENDNLIIVTVSDTAKLYERVRQAITYSDFIIREDSKKDTLITYSEKIDATTIHVIVKVVINNNKIEISGGKGLGIEDFWGYPGWPRSYERIVYYKGSESWLKLRRIAIKLDGKMEFSKIR
jgi:hypothetical protein